eukprot:2139402-Amphidinium_carterae.2
MSLNDISRAVLNTSGSLPRASQQQLANHALLCSRDFRPVLAKQSCNNNSNNNNIIRMSFQQFGCACACVCVSWSFAEMCVSHGPHPYHSALKSAVPAAACAKRKHRFRATRFPTNLHHSAQTQSRDNWQSRPTVLSGTEVACNGFLVGSMKTPAIKIERQSGICVYYRPCQEENTSNSN